MPTKSKGKGGSGAESTSAMAELIGGRVSTAQVGKALTALAQHREKSRASGGDHELPLDGQEGGEGEGSRVDRNDVVWLQLTVKRLNANAPIKAVRVPLPHAVWPTSSSVCLLTADPQRKYKDLMVEEKLTLVKRVVGVTKLKGKFSPFEAKRQLMNEHDVFLADDRIVAMLPKLLGKKWMEARKSPIPVKLTRTKNGHVSKEIHSALASTYFSRNKGTCSSIRLGTLSHLSTVQLTENFVETLPKIVAKHVKGGWENVQSVDIKTGNSVALPVWTSKLEDRWTGMPEPTESDESNDDEKDVEKPKSGKVSKEPTVKKPKAGEGEKKIRSSISKQNVAPKADKKAKKAS